MCTVHRVRFFCALFGRSEKMLAAQTRNSRTIMNLKAFIFYEILCLCQKFDDFCFAQPYLVLMSFENLLFCKPTPKSSHVYKLHSMNGIFRKITFHFRFYVQCSYVSYLDQPQFKLKTFFEIRIIILKFSRNLISQSNNRDLTLVIISLFRNKISQKLLGRIFI